MITGHDYNDYNIKAGGQKSRRTTGGRLGTNRNEPERPGTRKDIKDGGERLGIQNI